MDRVGKKQLCREGGLDLAEKKAITWAERQFWTPNTACQGN